MYMEGRKTVIAACLRVNRTLRAEELTEMRSNREGIPNKMGFVGKADRREGIREM